MSRYQRPVWSTPLLQNWEADFLHIQSFLKGLFFWSLMGPEQTSEVSTWPELSKSHPGLQSPTFFFLFFFNRQLPGPMTFSKQQQLQKNPIGLSISTNGLAGAQQDLFLQWGEGQRSREGLLQANSMKFSCKFPTRASGIKLQISLPLMNKSLSSLVESLARGQQASPLLLSWPKDWHDQG